MLCARIVPLHNVALGKPHTDWGLMVKHAVVYAGVTACNPSKFLSALWTDAVYLCTRLDASAGHTASAK